MCGESTCYRERQVRGLHQWQNVTLSDNDIFPHPSIFYLNFTSGSRNKELNIKLVSALSKFVHIRFKHIKNMFPR